MAVEIRNPIYLLVENWIILLIGYLGIPLLPLDGVVVDQSQAYILSFLSMNFNFFGNTDTLTILIIGWSVSIVVFGIFLKPDWKIPIFAVLAELIVFLSAIILLKRHSPILFQLIKLELLEGFGIVCGFLCMLYIPILIHYLTKKRVQEKKKENVEPKFIHKCPHCGKEYQSNPIICYSCSKQILSS